MKPALVAVIVVGLLLSVALLGLGTDNGGWQLDNSQSRLSFVSTKAKDIGEVHQFTQISGSVQDTGSVLLAVDLASVDTLIPLRDERMRNMLFNVTQFPEATLAGQIDMASLSRLSVGDSLRKDVEFILDLHGKQAAVVAELMISRLDTNRIQVASFKPVIINAGSFDLGPGIELLRQAAGLPGISGAVPVSFVLTFAN